MKALSLKQPWANMIADGSKTIETRKWSTDYRGPLLIVSSKKPDLKNFPEMNVEGNGPHGHAVAVVRLVGCRPMEHGDEADAGCEMYPGAVAWLLEDAKRIKPFPVKGSLGLYDVEIKEDQIKGDKK